MKAKLVFAVVAVLLCWVLPAPGAEWKAGIARTEITPQKAIWMAGYASRDHLPDGTIHPLWAKALAIEDSAGSRLVIVTTDLIGIPGKLGDAVCARVKKSTGIARERVLLNSSHTHSGPVVLLRESVTYGLTPEQYADARAYAGTLQEKLAGLIETACAAMQPAELSYGVGEATFSINRRSKRKGGYTIAPNAKGPVDHRVPVLRVSDAQGKLVAVLFGYACHNTTTAIYQYNGDYAGFAQIALEQAHRGATALFMIGCGGDSNPEPRGKIELARQHGDALAAAVDKTLAGKLHPVGGPLRVAFERVDLPLVDPPTKKELEERRGKGNKYQQRLTEQLLEKLEKGGKIRTALSCPVQVVRFGNDLSLAALGGEVVVDYALRLHKEFPRERLWVAGYSNNVPAYIPSERVLAEGGYEGGGAMVYFGVHGPFRPGLEDRLVGTVKRLMARCGQGGLPPK